MTRKKGRTIIIILLLLPFLLLIPVFLVSFEKPHEIFPLPEGVSRETVWTYNDPVNSQVLTFDVDEKRISFGFIHRQPESFAGIGINLSEYPAFFDVSPFSSIHLTMSAETIKTCSITLKLFVQGITDLHDDASYRHFGFVVPVTKEKTGYVLPISRFQDAPWWILDYNPGRKKIGNESLKNACFLIIDNGPGDKPSGLLNAGSSITVYHISLHKSFTLFYILAALGAGGYYLLMFTFFSLRKKGRGYPVRRIMARWLIKKEPERIIEHKKLMVENYRDADLKKIITCLETRYMEPDISLGKMSEECGLSSTRISSLIKDEYGLSFKQLLNRIRLTEAKRLLRETDMQIIDIAFSLGYNDRSYFYKVFLKNEGISPSDFKKKYT